MLAELSPEAKRPYPQTVGDLGKLAALSETDANHHLWIHEQLEHGGQRYEVGGVTDDGKVILIERSSADERMGIAETDAKYLEQQLEDPESGWHLAA
jgi:hypothetical protein